MPVDVVVAVVVCRLLWNYGAIILSLAINVIMLVTWNAKASMEDCGSKLTDANGTLTCPLLYE